MELLIDDVRNLKADVIARNAKAGWRMLCLGRWDCVILDNDLGDGEGYDLMKRYFATFGMEQSSPRIEVVTSNPIAKEKIKLLLLDNGYKSISKTDTVFEKV